MKHLMLSLIALIHHPRQVEKPALNAQLLDNFTKSIITEDDSKLICAYPQTIVQKTIDKQRR
jgi:hypothetical protein